MSKCVGRDGKVCGKIFFDPQFPDDNLCDQCFAWYQSKEEGNA